MHFSPTFNSPWIAIFSLGNYIIAFICLYAAYKKNLFFFSSLLTTVIFGFLVEYNAMNRIPVPYHYDQYFILLGGTVPLGICFGWAATFYAVIVTTELLNIPKMMRPFVSSFLAVTIDIVFDPIAVKMNLWTWTEKTNWFDIPWSNYVGWFFIVASLTSMFLVAEILHNKYKKRFTAILFPLLAIIPAFIICALAVNGYVKLVSLSPSKEPLYIALLVTIAIIVFIKILPYMKHDNDINILAISLPLYTFFSGTIAFYVIPVYKSYEVLALITPAFTTISILLFLLPYKDIVFKKREN